ncbi:hypothetical protein F5Y16DRAFT_400981 [Xylariaceae sp. FL0255]|nr:hypothetical protein F5Y16DRAFT_400981 [Xylariaceae sp. FL0255]
MVSPATWLELRSGAPGLNGPFLQEDLSAFRNFDRFAESELRFLVAIGDQQKARFLEDVFYLPRPPVNSADRIRLRCLPVADPCVLADCELHRSQQLQRVKAAPQPGNFILYELRERRQRDTAELACELYHRVLSPFATAVLVFVSDLGGPSGVLRLLSCWARDSFDLRHAVVPTTVVLIEGEGAHALPTIKDLYFQLSTELLNHLRVQNPTLGITFARVDSLVRRCLDLRILAAPHVPSQLRSALVDIAHQATFMRRRLRMAFSGLHLKALLRSALAHFAEYPTGAFSIALAARENNPIPAHLRYHMADFLRCARAEGINRASSMAQLVAAALLLDAYPPGMHHFSPAYLFSEYYDSHIAFIEDAMQLLGFRDWVQRSFIYRANQSLSGPTSFAERHLDFLREASAGALKCPRTSCTAICGREADPWTFVVPHCPLCQEPNKIEFRIRPPTAGSRILTLTGQSPVDTWDFIKGMRGRIHLSSLVYRDYFDLVTADNIGIFFALTLFCGGWTLSDCRHHLPRLQPPSFAKTGEVKFAKGLQWPLRSIREANGAGYILRGKKDVMFSNLFVGRKSLDM